MVDEQLLRSRAARKAAETALVRIVDHYGDRPEFVVLGGLVPDLLCAQSEFQHAGTIDVDVQVDLEIAGGAVNAVRLEHALLNAGFAPENARTWRWVTDGTTGMPVVKFELLADLHDQPADTTISFDACEKLGAVNLRGTGFAARDAEIRELTVRDGSHTLSAEVNIAGIAGFLLAKTAAAFSRRKAKDWYDIAFVLLHNDAGGTATAVELVEKRFPGEIFALRSALNDLGANFGHPAAQGAGPTSPKCSSTIPISTPRRSPPMPSSPWRSSARPCGIVPIDRTRGAASFDLKRA